ncbi:MAG: hypothetical protein M3N93_11855, partial [Acidobacteriota bacterium]|nr:hypothetical protein [Acidobacteriota bacterium]
IPLMSGIWAKNILPATYMNTFPGEPESMIQWGHLYASSSTVDLNVIMGPAIALRAFAGTPEAAYANYWIRNLLPATNVRFGTTPINYFWTEANLNRALGTNDPETSSFLTQSWLYLFTDPADPATNLSEAPLQKGFNVTDAAQYPIAHFISRTSLTDFNATVVELYADYLVNNNNSDHFWQGLGHPASYKILKNNYLLAEDDVGPANPDNLFSGGYTVGFDGSGQQSNYIQLGDDSTLENDSGGQHVLMPKAYDSNNNAAYALVDATHAYTNSPTRVYRHLMHLKKPGTQEFVFVYDDVATRGAVKKTTFLHYANNGSAPRGTTTYAAGVITSNYPGTGHGDATQLLSEVFSPAGPGKVAIKADGASYTGGGGNSYRFSLCASVDGSTCDANNTNAEFLVVHMPVLGTNNSMPDITGFSGPYFAGVQVGGTSPKIALFPRNGQIYSSASFVATYAGTAQIGVAGLLPGRYTVSLNSQPLAVATVAADGFLYTEGPSGTYSISGRPSAGFQLQKGAVQGGKTQ